jgi:hypothetical protein
MTLRKCLSNWKRGNEMNPYKILDIDSSADKKAIIQAAALALRERRFSAKEIAIAQKELLDSVSRAAHDFLQFIDLRPLRRPVPSNGCRTPEISKLTRLSLFDEES